MFGKKKTIIYFDGGEDAIIWKGPITCIDKSTELIVNGRVFSVFIYYKGKSKPLTAIVQNERVFNVLKSHDVEVGDGYEFVFVKRNMLSKIEWGTPLLIHVEDTKGRRYCLGGNGTATISVSNPIKMYSQLSAIYGQQDITKPMLKQLLEKALWSIAQHCTIEAFKENGGYANLSPITIARRMRGELEKDSDILNLYGFSIDDLTVNIMSVASPRDARDKEFLGERRD